MSTLDDINALFEDFGPPEEEKPQQIEEKIDVKSSSMGEVIKDFRKSKAPQFKGKSKKKKQEMAIAAKLQTEQAPAPQTYQERLMNDVDKYISAHRKVEPNVKPLQEVPLDEERIKNIETKLDQVRLLFHEATMVSGIGQGGDGQTPGSGEVRILRMDDVYAPNGFTQGQGLLWDAGIGKFVPGASDGSGAPIFAVDQLVAGPGIDLNPPGGVGTVTISADLAVTDLRDVNGTPTDGDLLVYNSGVWDVGSINTSQLALSNPQGGNPYGITRVDLVGPYDTQEDANQLFGEILAEYEGRIDALENATEPGTFLGKIDCTVAGNEPADPHNGDYFVHTGATGALWGVGDDVEDGNQVIYDGAAWVIVSSITTLAQLGDTDVDSAVTGDLLVYNDATDIWESATVPIPTVTVGTIQPNTGAEKDGDFFYDQTNEILYIYDSVWTVAGGGGGASVEISASPPDPAVEGDLWVDNDDWITYVYDGYNWVALTSGGLTGAGTYVTDAVLGATVDTLNFNTSEVQNNLNVAVLALDQTHLRVTPQAQLLGPLLLSDDDLTSEYQAVSKGKLDTILNDFEDGLEYLPLDGGQITGTLTFKRGDKTDNQFKISPNSSQTDYATNIYSMNGGQMRLRTSHTTNEGDHVGSHIVMDPNGGTPETKIYHVVTPTSGAMAANKSYVDSQVAGGVPVGSIMIWMNSNPPTGWFKMQGGSFDVNTYPQLHAYLQNTDGYASGTLPDWSGYFPGEYGGTNGNGTLGSKQGYRTGQPSGGPPKNSGSTPDGSTRTFTATGNTNAYSAGLHQLSIDSGWDSVTRPNTILVHYIIKHD